MFTVKTQQKKKIVWFDGNKSIKYLVPKHNGMDNIKKNNNFFYNLELSAG
jgi:hypothetical protein